MFKNIKIENFRCFKSFELQQLGRVNLLVGENNSGKTSILEAIQLLCSPNNLEPLGEMMIHRGEYFCGDNDKKTRELEIKHLFYNREIEPNKKLSISGMRNNILEQLNFSIQIHSISQLSAINSVLDAVPDYLKNIPENDIQKIDKLKQQLQAQVQFSENSKELDLCIEWAIKDVLNKEKLIPLSPNAYLDISLLHHAILDSINQQLTNT